MENLFFVWEHLMQRFSEIQDQCTPELSKEDLDEREKQFSHLRCIVLLVLSKMMKSLSENNSCEQRYFESIIIGYFLLQKSSDVRFAAACIYKR